MKKHIEYDIYLGNKELKRFFNSFHKKMNSQQKRKKKLFFRNGTFTKKDWDFFYDW